MHKVDGARVEEEGGVPQRTSSAFPPIRHRVILYRQLTIFLEFVLLLQPIWVPEVVHHSVRLMSPLAVILCVA